ncbi:MAG TPA: hypothetical protein EYM52_04810 [Dehalococcoidia bacterium]|nr:hypothetical protein [Dehalococcoidia bacterium]
MKEENVNQQDPASMDESRVDAHDTTGSGAPKLPSAYETLMKQHRDAIIRIHTLETENQNLMNLLKQALSDNALSFDDRGANPSELLSRIQALEDRNEQSARHQEDVPPPSSSGNVVSTTSVPGHEMVQFRVQNQTLVSQVAKMDGELQAMKSERARRRRRSDSGDRKHSLLKRMFGG